MIRFRFVHDNSADLSVERMCALVEVPRSSFYAWHTRKPSARELADVVLLDKIREIYNRSRRTYGVPRMVGQLQRRGTRVARSRVARLMRANGLVGAHTRKKWRRGRPDAGGAPNLLTASSALTARTSCGLLTSASSRPAKASSTWQPFGISTIAESLAGTPRHARTRSRSSTR